MNRTARLNKAGLIISGDIMIAENLIDRLNAQTAALMNRAPVLPPRDCSLVLRAEWRTDRPNPKLGRLPAPAAITMRRKAERPAPCSIAAE